MLLFSWLVEGKGSVFESVAVWHDDNHTQGFTGCGELLVQCRPQCGVGMKAFQSQGDVIVQRVENHRRVTAPELAVALVERNGEMLHRIKRDERQIVGELRRGDRFDHKVYR